MRRPVEAQRSPATGAAEPVAGRRGRTAGKPESEPRASSPLREPVPVAVTAVRLLRVDEGLHALRIGPIAGPLGEIAGMVVPVAHVSVPFAEDGNGVEIVAAFPRRGPWLEKAGGTVVLRSPIGGGHVIVTVYGGEAQPASELPLDLRRLDGPADAARETAATVARPVGTLPPDTEAHDVPTEILLHIERAGDRLFPGRGWVGALGRRMRIEAFSIRPLERLAPTDIEMKGFMPNGGETPWVPGGTLCGTRGRGLPLIGFAVRVAAQQAGRFEIAYQGSFFAGGISQMHQNGAPCRAAIANDPLEAINVRVIERAGDAEGTETTA